MVYIYESTHFLVVRQNEIKYKKKKQFVAHGIKANNFPSFQFKNLHAPKVKNIIKEIK